MGVKLIAPSAMPKLGRSAGLPIFGMKKRIVEIITNEIQTETRAAAWCDPAGFSFSNVTD
jgi:hypothetical protein